MTNTLPYTSLKDFYLKLESLSDFGVSEVSRNLKLLLDSNQDPENQSKLKFELLAFDFLLKEGKVKPVHATTAKDGRSILSYPSMEELGNEGLKYLERRISETQNKWLHIRYGQILLSSNIGVLKGKLFKSIIDCYITILLENSNTDTLITDKGRIIVSIFENLFPLTVKANYRLDFVSDASVKFMQKAEFPLFSKIQLLRIVLGHRKKFAKEQLESVYAVVELWIKNLPHSENLHFLESAVPFCIRLCSSLSKDGRMFYNQLAFANELHMEKTKNDPTGMIPMEFCERAIENYKLAGNKEKVETLSIRYVELRGNLKFQKGAHEFKSKKLFQLFKHYRKEAKHLVQYNESDALIAYLCNATDIFPNIEWLKEAIRKRKPSLRDVFTILKSDVNKNFSRKIVSEDDHFVSSLYEQYDLYIQLTVLQRIKLIFYYGFLKNKITYETIIQFFQKCSWIGKDLQRRNSDGEIVYFNWLSLIAPALHEFYHGLHSYFYSDQKYFNLILPIDSLTLKFEGLLREFARLLKVNTICNDKGNMREMYIEELLCEQKVREYFNENDVLLFKYLFTSKDGINLRNNVAHAFYRFEHYTFDKMILLLMAIFRLGKYEVN